MAKTYFMLFPRGGVTRKSIDLTTLPGWANLTSGNHVIKLKARGTGYKDSELSVGVTVSKVAPNPNTVSISGITSAQEFVALNSLTPFSDVLTEVQNAWDNYSSKTWAELIVILGFDTENVETQSGTAITVENYEKLTTDCSCVCIKEGNNYTVESVDFSNAKLSSPQLLGETVSGTNILCVGIDLQVGKVYFYDVSSIIDNIATITEQFNLGMTFFIKSTARTLEAGTYKFVDTLTLPQCYFRTRLIIYVQ